ncbi:MAG: M20 family metallopeptidase [Bacillota bacterium]
MDDAGVLALAKTLIQFDTTNPPGNEGGLARFAGRYLEGLGVEVSLHSVGTGRLAVVARLPGDLEGILVFNGHSDVVPAGSGWTTPPFRPEVRDGRLYGRGSTDMKGGVAAMMAAVSRLAQVPACQRATVVLHIVPDEEDKGLGTRYLVDHGLVEADAAIVGEPTGLQVQVAHKGILWVKATFHGKSAHASMPGKGVNAIYKASSAIERLKSEMATRLARTNHPLLGSPSVSVGVINGGTRVNTVPDRCEVWIDRRLVPGEDASLSVQEIREVLSPDSLEIDNLEEPMEVSESEPIVSLALGCARAVTGEDRGIAGFPGATDARFYVNDAGIPTILLGPGSISRAHTADEWVPVEDLENAAAIYFEIARNFRK